MFSAGFSATILAVPWIMALARRLGAVDAPDGFRKTHHGIVPRMGGLAVAFGLFAAFVVYSICGTRESGPSWSVAGIGWETLFAFIVILGLGMVDDLRGLGAPIKLAAQCLAAYLLYLDGYRIERVFVFGRTLEFGDLGVLATVVWFLACMNVWNLIDGMDGLASGVGIIVSVTMLIAAGAMGHVNETYAAAALAGALAGFLIYNFHPSKIFLGDTGSLLIGTLMGMLAIRGSLKSGMTVAILVPILAMGLPIIDTFLAIVRRWVRRLPLSTADRGHLHHRLLAMGLTQRQASFFLYGCTVLLCAAALTSISAQSDLLAVLFGTLGVTGLCAVVVARREDRTNFFADFRDRLRGREIEQRLGRMVWETIQRMEQCTTTTGIMRSLESFAGQIGCRCIEARYVVSGAPRLAWKSPRDDGERPSLDAGQWAEIRFHAIDPSGHLTLTLVQRDDEALPIWAGGRFLRKLNQAMLASLQRIERAGKVGDAEISMNGASRQRLRELASCL